MIAEHLQSYPRVKLSWFNKLLVKVASPEDFSRALSILDMFAQRMIEISPETGTLFIKAACRAQTPEKALEILFNESLAIDQKKASLELSFPPNPMDVEPEDGEKNEYSNEDKFYNDLGQDEQWNSDCPREKTLFVDNLVPEILKKSLKQGLDAIASGPNKDFHPGTEGQVQDLIHPSLFPLVHGVSFVRPMKGSDNVPIKGPENVPIKGPEHDPNIFVPPPKIPKKKKREDEDEDRPVDDEDNGDEVDEDDDMLNSDEERPWFQDRHDKIKANLKLAESTPYQWLPAEFKIADGRLVSIDSYINNLDQQKYPLLYEDIASIFKLILPLFGQLNDRKVVDLSRRKNLQVIVKAANYIIEPGTAYNGTWHVEGTPIEHIVASAIYYYHVDPCVTDNYLLFRGIRSEHAERAMAAQSLPFNVNMGRIQTPEDRVIVFSNEVQHKIRVRNTSKTDQGLRKILCFFVVDPSQPIVSSARVPPQQWDQVKPQILWNLNYVCKSLTKRGLPKEIASKIAEHGKYGFTWEEAEEHRKRLMDTRKYYMDVNNQLWEREFSFCEH